MPNGTPFADPRLVVYVPPMHENPGAAAKLAWVMELRDDLVPARNLYVVDAVEGGVLDVIERLHTASEAHYLQAQVADGFGYPVGTLPLTREQGDGDGWTVYGNGYGAKDVTFPGTGCIHPGDDWNKEPLPFSDVGQEVRAIGKGTVEEVRDLGNLGFGVAVSHFFKGIKYFSVYIHVKSVVQKNQPIERGELLGTIEQFSGISPHLHFEVRTLMTPSGDGYPNDADCNGDGKGDGYYGSLSVMESDGFVDPLAFIKANPPGSSSNRQTYNANHTSSLPGTLARSEGNGPIGDKDVDNAHDFAGATYDYYYLVHSRYSYDNKGATLVSTAHYGKAYKNAFWNGEQMVYGDRFSVNDVVAHELTHAVTENTAALEYRWQSGALNESFSDIFAAMVDRDDWTIGEDLPPGVLAGRPGIRDMSNPPRFGQPGHVKDWVKTCSDSEGVHTNSGITNKAFYNIATAIGKDKAEKIFYRALTVYLQPIASLEDARASALQSAQDLYGLTEKNAVSSGFNAVGLDGAWQPSSNDCTCAFKVALADSQAKAGPVSTLDALLTLYRARSQLLDASVTGQYYRKLYEKHTNRISYLLLKTPELRSSGFQVIKEATPGLKQLMDGKGGNAVVSQQMLTDVMKFLQDLANSDRANGGRTLAQDIEQEMKRLDLSLLTGMTFAAAREYIDSRAGTASVASGTDTAFSPKRVAGASGYGDERDSDSYPAIAYDAATDRYLTAWTTARQAQLSSDGLDVYAVFLDNNGQPTGSEFRISDNNNASRNRSLAVVGGNGEFVVAWAARGPSCQIYVQRVANSSYLTDSVLLSGTGHRHSPSLAFNSVRKRYVLAFVEGDDYLPPKLFGATTEDCGNNPSSGSQVRALEFYFEGNKLVVGSTFDVGDSDYGAFRPQVSYSAGLNEYMVVWEDRRKAAGNPSRFDVYAKLLTSDLTKVSDDIAVATGGDYANYGTSGVWTPRPIIAAGDKQFLVAWFTREAIVGSVLWSVRGLLLPAAGAQGTTFTIAEMPFAESHNSQPPTGFLAAGYSNSSQGFMVAMSTYLESIWGYFPFALAQRVSESGGLLEMDGSPQSEPGVGKSVDFDNDDQISVAMAVNSANKSGTPRYIVAYSKHPTQALTKDFEIYAAVALAAETPTPTPKVVPGILGPGLGILALLLLAGVLLAHWSLRRRTLPS